MNIQNMMAQAQKMQRDIEKKKAEIDATIFTGKSEWVEVEFYGNKKLKSIKILKDGGIEQDEFEILEDMITIATNDALEKIEKETADKMGSYGSALNGLF